MLKLYYVPFTRAVRVRWMLEELAVPYELHRVDVAQNEHKTPEYMRYVHPLGHVPALRDGETVMFESAAIIAYLADRFPDNGLAPGVGTAARAAYYQWMFYAMHELDAWLARIAEHTRFYPEERRIPALVEEAKSHVARAASVVDEHLAERPYLLGTEFSACDIVMAGCAGFMRLLGLLQDHANLQAYHQRATSRPAYQRATAD